MEDQLLKRSVFHDRSFIVEDHSYENFLNVWHYHPETELVVIVESTGTRFVGDSIQRFKAGEIVLIGENLPHVWLNDDKYFEENSCLKAKANVIRFDTQFQNGLLNVPEMQIIAELFEQSKRGIKFDDTSNAEIFNMVDALFQAHGLKRIKIVLDILECLAVRREYEFLASPGFVRCFEKKKDSKILQVYEYVLQNFKNDISLNDVAKLVNMNPSSFSRYFKRIQKKTFSQFLKEVKIGYACKLLLEQKYNISEVCYRSGFNNISNFNRQFKAEKNMTPTVYIEKHTASATE